LAQRREAASGQLSLSPASLQTLHSVTKLMLPSPMAGDCPLLLPPNLS
jgi:hypothetical protein